MMDPQMFVDQASAAGIPAPHWFIQFFKVLGFTLHSVPMNLWYAGVILAMIFYGRNNPHGRRFATRLMRQMPVIIAFGVNFGIVPLLFVQLAYFKVFYPATILMAWFWMAIVALLIPAYYGVYIYAMGLRDEGPPLSGTRRLIGWCSAVCFIAIGFLFANGFSLMANVEAWGHLWRATSVGGAPLGFALNVADPSLWPRWLMMFGLALTTTAAWSLVDAAWFARHESEEYRRWVPGFAVKVYTTGLVWFALMGSWYVFGTWSERVRETMLGGNLAALTFTTGAIIGLPWLVILATRNAMPSRITATLIGLLQFVVLAINATSRQIVQLLELRPALDVMAQPVDVKWSPLLLFLAVFVAGLGVIGWMVAQVVFSRVESP